MTTPSAATPGWYPDPQSPGQQRYWDGSQWSAQTAPGSPAGGPGGSSTRTEPLAIWSLVLSIAGVLCGVGAIAGVICGHLALGSIKRKGTGGRGLAIAGLVIGYLLILSFVAIALIVLLGDSTESTLAVIGNQL